MTDKGDYAGQVVWIVGASSGIGAALARELGARGAVLALSARRKDELEKLRAEVGPQHKVFVLDLTDTDTTLRTAQAVRATFGRIDRVVFLAAAYVPMKMDALDLAVTKAIVDINLTAAFNLVQAVLRVLKPQATKGQIALCGSVAGFIGLPGGQPYSATKAAITNLAESLHAEFRDVIDIKLISPGFVRTPLTDKNNFDMPMIIEPEQAAKEIADGLLSRRFEIHFPKRFTTLLKVLQVLPYSLSLRLTHRMKT
ncbi:SDR family NAD(P)-dependent oxidoreductase [Niveispirillum sp. KHB5.9]|uniref:SDR family NAD(P)-dependent oxidoreductase n=1 Tax=Niveispirillum sp. KHB5.9 TaxID=3400269 RepID=UPI003A86696A